MGQRTCFNADGLPKMRYDTRRETRDAIARRPLLGDAKPYRCMVCGYFHIGHYPKAERARSALRRHDTDSEREHDRAVQSG